MCKCLLCIYLTCFCYQMDNSLNLHKVILLQLYLIEYQSADCFLCISNFNFNTLLYSAKRSSQEKSNSNTSPLLFTQRLFSERHVGLPSGTERLPSSNEVYLQMREEYFLTRPFILVIRQWNVHMI